MIQITPPQNPQYWINQRALTFSENDLENVNRIAVSLVSGTVIMVYEKGVIDYAPDGNFQKWTLKGYSTRLVSNSAHHIYARLSRTEKDALIVFSINNYNIDGSITTIVTDSSGNPVLDEDGKEQTATSDPNPNYWYVKIGEITATDGMSNRDLTYDSGALGTKKGEEERDDWTQMFELSKTSTPWLIFVKQMFYEFTVKNPITLLGGLILSNGKVNKQVVDVKRSVDSDEDVPISDETIPTTKYMEGRHLSKIEPDETPHHIKLMGGVTTTDAVADSVTVDSVTAGKVTTPVVDFDINYTDDNGIEHNIVKPVNDIKRSVDANWEVPISDENVTTSAYLEKRIENLDDRYLSKIKPDETPYHIKLLNGLTTTYAESEDYAEGTEKGGWGINKDIDGYWKGEADKFVARVLGEVYKLVVNNEAVFKGSLSSEEFISGFVGGKGWAIRLQEYINAAGENEQRSIAEFDDLIVRGTMRVFEFVINQLLGENDNRVFTGMMEVDHYDADTNKIYLSTKGGKLYNPFRVDDVILVQQYGGDPSEGNDYYVTKQYEFVITGAGIGDKSEGEDRLDWVTFNEFTSTMEGAGVELITKGDTLVRIDNLYDNNRKGIVQIMSVGENTPYIDIIHGAKTDPENSVKGRIGNMGGLYSPLFGWLQEFGAYLVNLYAVGEFRIAHTGEDVSDSIEIAKSLFRTNFRQSSYDMTEEDNFFTNASMTNNCDGWSLAADEDEYFTIDDEPEFFNYELMSSYERFAGIAELNGRDMLRLSVGEAVQDNELIRKPGKHKVFTSTTENEDGSITKNYEEVDDTLYLSIRAYCEASGTLEFGFADADGNFYENNFHKSEELEESVDGYTFNLEGVWDGVGNFVIRSSGDIYLDLISLTDRPLDNFKITTSTSIEQDAERISLLGKKVNGVEGSVTNLGLELNSAEERITAYVDKEIKGVSASISQLEIDTEGIKTTVAGAQGSADKAQQAADAAQKAADDAAADALAAQKTADAANSKAAANATAIQQTKDSISLIAASFEDDGSGGLRLTSAAGSVITSEVAKTYATKKEVDAVSEDVREMNAEITTQAGQIALKAEASTVDSLGERMTNAESSINILNDSITTKVSTTDFDTYKGTVNTKFSSIEQSANDITSRVVDLEKTSLTEEDLEGYIKDTDKAFTDLQNNVSEALGFKTDMEEAGLTTTMVEQTKDTVNIVSGTFVLDENTGTYQLASAAGNYIKSDINNAVAATYATKDNVTAMMAAKVSYDEETGKITSNVLISADQIDINANDYISIINQGTTTIAASRVDLSGVVSVSALESTLEGYTTDGELNSAKAELNKSIDDLNSALTGKINEKASVDSLNSKVQELTGLINGKADSSALKNVAYVDDATNAALNGATLVVNGYLNTDYITVDAIEAVKGYVGGFTIEENILTVTTEIDSGWISGYYSTALTGNGLTVVVGDNSIVSTHGMSYNKDDNSVSFMTSLSVVNYQNATTRQTDPVCAVYAVLNKNDYGVYIDGGNNYIMPSDGCSTLIGGMRLRTKLVYSNYTTTASDDVIIVASIAVTTITLGDYGVDGKVIYLKNTTSATVNVKGDRVFSSSSANTWTSWGIGGGSHMFIATSLGWIHYNGANDN